MPKDYVTPNVNDDLQDRLQSITQQILSRTRLVAHHRPADLYADPHGRLTPDDKVERMRKDIGRSNWCATRKDVSAPSTFPTHRTILT